MRRNSLAYSLLVVAGLMLFALGCSSSTGGTDDGGDGGDGGTEASTPATQDAG